MKREIKFRAKHNGESFWVYGELHQNCRIQHIHDEFNQSYKIDTNTIGQYTGLKDKNCVEIYEGDIVKAPLLDPIFRDIIKDAFINAEIKFNQGSFVVSYYKGEHNIYLSDLCNKVEVIGNIYDNKDLLED